VADTLEDHRAAAGVPTQSGPRRRPFVPALVGVALAAVLAVVLFVGVGTHQSAPQVAPGIDLTASYLLKLDVFGRSGPLAPNFTLTDQHGRTVSLAQFRGRSVVLSFNDDRCTDICTLLAEDVVAADRDLGAAAKGVVFLSVNANPYYPAVSAVRSWTDDHGLGRERNWVFGTGPPAALTKVWHDYGVEVELDPTSRTVVHSTELYFIGPNGREAALGSFGTASADTAIYSHTMAQMADDLLPGNQQVSVGGPSALAPGQSDAAIGARVPTFDLPIVTAPGRTVSSGSLLGRYTVLNFWSSTCTACVREMPAMEKAHRDLGNRVGFVGVDVSDNRAAAAGFARRVGVTYPLVSDASGDLASTYQIPGLPFTAIVGPHGTLQTLHPGALTTQQLEYIVETLDPALVHN
jgi:cytochrome oxidase Cu insertion factor (SCO1/SenC/PrrC family)